MIVWEQYVLIQDNIGVPSTNFIVKYFMVSLVSVYSAHL